MNVAWSGSQFGLTWIDSTDGDDEKVTMIPPAKVQKIFTGIQRAVDSAQIQGIGELSTGSSVGGVNDFYLAAFRDRNQNCVFSPSRNAKPFTECNGHSLRG